jgi:hypothetical protein
MCAAPKPPAPKAPPAPVPKRDEVIDARGKSQKAARRGALSGYGSTQVTTPGESVGAGGTRPVLGG